MATASLAFASLPGTMNVVKSALQAPEKPCWHALWRAKLECPSSTVLVRSMRPCVFPAAQIIDASLQATVGGSTRSNVYEGIGVFSIGVLSCWSRHW